MLNIVDNCMSACNNSMTYFAATDRSHDFNKFLPSRLI